VDDHDPEFEALLQHLKETRGFDFTGYKRASLTRRVQKRMQDVDVATFAEYQTLLQEVPAEFVELFNTILINVTAFQRDKAAWDHISSSVIPR
ncbi:hypothetical protein, partial [Pseudomonas viridiflava]|uniref:hypothetical protein n=1 Tax=Pseudomonas viridiflava TaxID=33069 RepID=UPI00197FBC07